MKDAVGGCLMSSRVINSNKKKKKKKKNSTSVSFPPFQRNNREKEGRKVLQAKKVAERRRGKQGNIALLDGTSIRAHLKKKKQNPPSHFLPLFSSSSSF